MSDYSKLQHIKVEKEGKLLIATLNRPEVLNAINPALHREIEDFFGELSVDNSVNVAILTGAGRAFCAGGDVKGMSEGAAGEPRGVPWNVGYRRIINNLLSVEIPIIAAVNGSAVGLGATLALFCDTVIMADNARIGDTHVNVGLVAGDGGAVIWPLLIGVNKSKQFLMTGELIPAAEAERIGLVNKVVPAGEVMTAARQFAQRLADLPPLAVRWTKVSVNKQVKERMNLVLDTSLAFETITMMSEDHKEAATAFVEKRPGKFLGR